MSSAFAFHVVCVWYGLKSAPTHHNHSLTTGPIFGVQLTLYIFLSGVLIGVLLMPLFRGESPASANYAGLQHHHEHYRSQERGPRTASSQASVKHEEGTQSPKELSAPKALIAETNTDSDNFLKIDEIIRNGTFQSNLQEFEAFCSSSRRENVVAYLLACVDGGDEGVLMRMNAAALLNPSESIRDQALICLISLSGIDFTNHEAAIKWAASNLNLGDPPVGK
jgi:hypothetical protein